MGMAAGFTLCANGDITCRAHGYRFNGATGAFVENPNVVRLNTLRTPSSTFDPAARQSYQLREYAVRIEDGWVSVD